MKWCVLFALFGAASVGAADRCVRIKVVRPSAMFVKQGIAIEAHVYRHEDHRLLRLTWLRDGLEDGSSDRELHGTASPFLHTLTLRDQPPGDYEFIAAVYNQLGKVVQSDRTFLRGPSASDDFQ